MDPYGRAHAGTPPPKRRLSMLTLLARVVLILAAIAFDVAVGGLLGWLWTGADLHAPLPGMLTAICVLAVIAAQFIRHFESTTPLSRRGVTGILLLLALWAWHAGRRLRQAADRPVWKDGAS